ncbi:NUDIX domain-containing protein, partial [Staphylococcus aureus]|nr:NUDIX domain-containing protein [Staphylococcus aureus]
MPKRCCSYVSMASLLLILVVGACEVYYVLAFPKGAVDAGESLFEAANRELMEEVGYGARQLHWLKNLRLSPSYMEYQIDVILAHDLYPEKRP